MLQIKFQIILLKISLNPTHNLYDIILSARREKYIYTKNTGYIFFLQHAHFCKTLRRTINNNGFRCNNNDVTFAITRICNLAIP